MASIMELKVKNQDGDYVGLIDNMEKGHGIDRGIFNYVSAMNNASKDAAAVVIMYAGARKLYRKIVEKDESQASLDLNKEAFASIFAAIMQGAQKLKTNDTYVLPGTSFFDIDEMYKSENPGAMISEDRIHKAMKYLNRCIPQLQIKGNREESESRKISDYLREAEEKYQIPGFPIVNLG